MVFLSQFLNFSKNSPLKLVDSGLIPSFLPKNREFWYQIVPENYICPVKLIVRAGSLFFIKNLVS